MTTSVPRNLIAIIGTTGVGKSQFSIDLAKALNGEIINGDSMQVYRGLDAITNKHPVPERENIPHHLLGHVPWADEYSVQQFEREALSVLDDVYSRGKLPILVGGTHYYNQAVIFKNSTLAEDPTAAAASPDAAAEHELTPAQLKVLDGPTQGIIDELKVHDPLVAQKFHPNDGRRLRRALEVFYTTGKKPSDLYLQQKRSEGPENNGDDTHSSGAALDARFRTLVFWIWSEQTQLNKRLDERVDAMLNNSLYAEIDEMYKEYLDETKDGPSAEEKDDSAKQQLLTKGVWQVIGFRQFLPWLSSGKASPTVLSECVEEMKRATRKYSKQQTKFMKNTLMPKINTVIEKNSRTMDHSHSIVATILDATDLSQWNDKVAARGIEIARQFMGNRLDNCILVDDRDAALKELLVTPKQFDETQWQTFTCPVCENSEGQKYVAVGEAQWEQHLKSRKHKGTLSRAAKMKRNAEEMAKRGIVKKSKKELKDSKDGALEC